MVNFGVTTILMHRVTGIALYTVLAAIMWCTLQSASIDRTQLKLKQVLATPNEKQLK